MIKRHYQPGQPQERFYMEMSRAARIHSRIRDCARYLPDPASEFGRIARGENKRARNGTGR